MSNRLLSFFAAACVLASLHIPPAFSQENAQTETSETLPALKTELEQASASRSDAEEQLEKLEKANETAAAELSALKEKAGSEGDDKAALQEKEIEKIKQDISGEKDALAVSQKKITEAQEAAKKLESEKAELTKQAEQKEAELKKLLETQAKNKAKAEAELEETKRLRADAETKAKEAESKKTAVETELAALRLKNDDLSKAVADAAKETTQQISEEIETEKAAIKKFEAEELLSRKAREDAEAEAASLKKNIENLDKTKSALETQKASEQLSAELDEHRRVGAEAEIKAINAAEFRKIAEQTRDELADKALRMRNEIAAEQASMGTVEEPAFFGIFKTRRAMSPEALKSEIERETEKTRQAEAEAQKQTEAHAAALEEIERIKAEIENLAVEQTGLNAKAEDMKIEVEKLEQIRRQNDPLLKETQRLARNRAAVEKQLSALKRQYEAQEQQVQGLRAYLDSADKLQAERDAAQAAASEARQKVDEEKALLQAAEEEVRMAKIKVEEMAKYLKSLERESKNVARTEAELEAAAAKRDEAEKEAAALQAKKETTTASGEIAISARASELEKAINDLALNIRSAEEFKADIERKAAEENRANTDKLSAQVNDLERQLRQLSEQYVEAQKRAASVAPVSVVDESLLRDREQEILTEAKTSRTAPSKAGDNVEKEWEASYKEGMRQWDRNEIDKALAAFKRAIELKKDSPGGYYNAALCYMRKEDKRSAGAYAYKAGKLYLAQGNVKQAYRMLLYLNHLDPASPLINILDKEISDAQ